MNITYADVYQVSSWFFGQGYFYAWVLPSVIFFTVLLLPLLLFVLCRSVKIQITTKPSFQTVPRFRKRDKLRYYAVHFTRRCSLFTERLNTIKSPEARRQLIIAFVRRIFNIPDELNAATLHLSRLPESFYEPDDDEDSALPDDLRLMINSIRVFGHLERSFFIDFCKFIERIKLSKGEYLFRVNDCDDNVYVVHTGMIQVCVLESDGSRSVINEVSRGGSIDSFISVLNVLSGNPSTHKTMEAVAIDTSTVLKLPIRAFLEICQPQTPALMRILQMITIRLQRLTAVAVQSHLGLCSELTEKEWVCRLDAPKAQEFLKKIRLSEPCDRNSTKCFDCDQEPPITLPCAHDGVFPLVSDTFELNSEGEILDEFEPDYLGKKHKLAVRGLCGELEFGEAPSRISTERSVLASAYAESAKILGPSHSPSYGGGFQDMALSNTASQTSQRPDDPVPEFFAKPSAPVILNIDRATKLGLLSAAEEDLRTLLRLSDVNALRGQVTLSVIEADTILSKESSMQTLLYYIVSGELQGQQCVAGVGSPGEICTLFLGRPGDVVGLLSLITGEPNVYTLKATKYSIVASLSREHFYALVRKHPMTLCSVIQLISARVSPLLHQLDFAIQWITILAGKALYKVGDPASFVYVVLSGRLRQVDSLPGGGHRIAGESGRGDMVGFLEVICSQQRVHTVIAIRDSELAQIPALLLHRLKHKVPQVLNRLIQLLSGRLLGNITHYSGASHLGIGLGASRIQDAIHYPNFVSDIKSESVSFPQLTKMTMSNLRTIAILPTAGSISAEAFALELQHSLTPMGSSVRLTSHIIRKRLGPTALSSVNQYRLNAWLSHQEDSHRIVFFVCDYTRNSSWNRLCIRQADCVLVLALGNGDPSRISALELTLKNHPTKVVKALVLMYTLATDYPAPRQTANWLNARPWISHHYHIRCEPRVFTVRDSADLVSFYSHVFTRERPNPLSDISRLARYLTGEAVGLVLGGGGARGCAHIGIIRALQEAGIPIDLVCGTSIGAFMSALWAEETRYAQFTQRARDFTKCFNSVWKKVKDFTYPAVSIFSGREFNQQLETVFKDRQIEDLWIPSFYVTTDITNCRMRVHTQGSLWRYVRASMTLSGYLPPLCDPYDGSLLLDGGYTNNLPADVMSAFGAKTIIAVDVGATVDTDFTDYGDHLSGWQLLYHRLFKSNKSNFRVPNLSEIQARLAYISCVRQLEQVKQSGISHYLRPPIDRYMTLQFTAFEEILNVGYDYCKNVLLDWYREGTFRLSIPGLLLNLTFEQAGAKQSTSRSPTSTPDRSTFNDWTANNLVTQTFDDHRTFLDLAETVCAASIPDNSSVAHSDADCEEYFLENTRGNGQPRKLSYDVLGSGFGFLKGSASRFADKKHGQIASLSQKVYSYLHSARHIVSNSLPNAGLFRRRALSDNLCYSSTSVSLESSEGGHFSDAQDYPGWEHQAPISRSASGYLGNTGSHASFDETSNIAAPMKKAVEDGIASTRIGVSKKEEINDSLFESQVEHHSCDSSALQETVDYMEDSESENQSAWSLRYRGEPETREHTPRVSRSADRAHVASRSFAVPAPDW